MSNSVVVVNLQDRKAVVNERVNRKAVVYARSAMGIRGPQGSMPLALTLRGPQIVGIGIIPLTLPFNSTILRLTAVVGIAPTGADLVFDILKNGVSILTSGYLVIQSGQTVAVPIVPDDTEFLIGDLLTVDVLQIGSINPGTFATIVAEVAQIE